MKDLAYRGLPELAIAEGATSPNPGVKSWAWSTTENAPVYWTGSAWVKPAAGGPTLSTPEAADVVVVDLFIPTSVGELVIGSGPVLDTTFPCFDYDWLGGVSVSTGWVIFLQHVDYNGFWVVGSTAVPSAVPLTRHPDWPDTSVLRSGTQVVATRSFAISNGVGVLQGVSSFSVSVVSLGVDTVASTVTGTFGGKGRCFFRFTSVDSGAALPGGLAAGTWYVLQGPASYDPITSKAVSEIQTVGFSPVVLTSTGTNSGSTGEIGTVQTLPVAQSSARVIVTAEPGLSDGGYLLSASSIGLEVEVLSQPQGSNPWEEVQASGYESVAWGWKARALGSSSTALGVSARAVLDYSTAVGAYALSIGQSLAVGANSLAEDGAVALNGAAAKHRSSAFGKSTYSDSQIAFSGPSTRFRDGFEVHQLYLDSSGWSVSAYPAKLYTSNRQRLATPTRSGWRCFGSYEGVNRFEGRCVVTFFDDGSFVSKGHAVLRVEGSVRPAYSSATPEVQYRVIEEESSYPGTLTLTLTPSEDPVDPTAMIEVDLSCSISLGTLKVDAYFGMHVWAVHNSNAASAAYVDSKVNRANSGILLTASEALTAGNLVNFWSDGGVAKMRKADASDDLAADGYVLQAVASGDKGYAYVDGLNDVVSGLTVGSLYLGESGAASSSASGAGGISQSVGFATSATSFVFQRGLPVQL